MTAPSPVRTLPTSGLVALSLLLGCAHDSKSIKLKVADQAAADEMAASMHDYYGPLAGLDEHETQCIAEASVARFGTVAPSGGTAVPGAAERRARATADVDIIIGCTDKWELIFLRTRTEGADHISDESARCVNGALPDEQSRSMWITELSGDYTDLHHLDPLLAVLDKCLTPKELNALDWN